MAQRSRNYLLLACFLGATPAQSQSVCQLCGPKSAPVVASAPKKPVHIDIETTLDFSKAAHTDIGSGSVEIDSTTGARRFVNLVGLGGGALKGKAIITGDPFRAIRIVVPTSVVLRSTQGATADVTGIVTNLPANPVIGADGTLTFFFGGKMTVRDGAAGDFHGRFAIQADYQ
jgi:Domain of unknown function (DUF4402)